MVYRLQTHSLPHYVQRFFGPPLVFMRVKPGYYRIVGQARSYGFEAANAHVARAEISRYAAAKLRSLGNHDKRRTRFIPCQPKP